jgi:type IV secretion system protein VirB10
MSPGAWLPSRLTGMPGPGGGQGEAAPAQGRGAPSLGGLLQPMVTTAVEAQILPTRRFLLPKGAFIDCTLETAIDSTLPGMTTCITATDTFSADGTVVLLERGTKLVGETRGEVEQGQSRIFVLWSEARTPSGVVVPLDSPTTDALGRSGLTGRVERHFWERFGAAILVSVIDGAVEASIESTSRNGGVIVNPSASEDVSTEVLKSTVDIPPTIAVDQGTRIEVLVARDVDFRSVYRLQPVSVTTPGGTP